MSSVACVPVCLLACACDLFLVRVCLFVLVVCLFAELLVCLVVC